MTKLTMLGGGGTMSQRAFNGSWYNCWVTAVVVVVVVHMWCSWCIFLQEQKTVHDTAFNSIQVGLITCSVHECLQSYQNSLHWAHEKTFHHTKTRLACPSGTPPTFKNTEKRHQMRRNELSEVFPQTTKDFQERRRAARWPLLYNPQSPMFGAQL